MKRPAELVFIPAPGIGHIVATIEIAKLLVARDDQLFVTVLLMMLPGDQLFTTTDSSISPRITFINLPVTHTHTDTQPTVPVAAGFFIRNFVENQKTHVRDAVAKLAGSNQSQSKPRLAGFVVDMFCTTMIDVADEFGVPSYMFFTSNASCLAFLFQLQALRDELGEDLAELTNSDAELILPSFVNPLPTKVFPGFLLNKEGAAAFPKLARSFGHTKGILVNTFLELESRALQSLCDGKTPPVYRVGPLLNLKSDDTHMGPDQTQKADLLEWLDDQPTLSVVFLCFGSRGTFGEAQVKEIACALEHSGHRFLWSLRQPPPKGTMNMPSDYTDPREVLPEGFLERTAEIGKVIGWAPQVTVLAHPAIGGFVSHCGWNSTLESLWYGVPIATWPMYAEQQLNAFEMVKEWGLAVEVRMDYRKDHEVVVSAEEIERGIRQVMELDSDIRERVQEMSEKSKKALMDGGSSHSSLGSFIDQI